MIHPNPRKEADRAFNAVEIKRFLQAGGRIRRVEVRNQAPSQRVFGSGKHYSKFLPNGYQEVEIET